MGLKIEELSQKSTQFRFFIWKLIIRLGAIPLLAIDSPKYHWTIVEILSAFIREKSPVVESKEDRKLTADIKAAVTILSRRKVEQDPQGQGIDLRKIHLAGIEIESEANFSNANFSNANFSNANFSNANLNKANLSGVNLRKSSLAGTTLIEAYLYGSDL